MNKFACSLVRSGHRFDETKFPKVVLFSQKYKHDLDYRFVNVFMSIQYCKSAEKAHLQFLGFRILSKGRPFTKVQLEKFLSDSAQEFRSVLIEFDEQNGVVSPFFNFSTCFAFIPYLV